MVGLGKPWANAGAAVIALMSMVAPAIAGGSCSGEYVVARGDTLSRIAARCGSSVEALMRANPRLTSPAQIVVGWRLTMPGGTASASSATASQPAPSAVTSQPVASQPVALTGRIFNGRRCAMIETADGESYGVVSRDLAFVNGASVMVRGEVVDDPSCTGVRTLRVDELTAAEPT